MDKTIPIFKLWVPEWLILLAITLVLFPTTFVFAIATAGLPQSVGYYGSTPNDTQFSLLLFYAAVTSYPPLERHFFTRIATKEYFWISLILLIVSLYGGYHVHNVYELFVFRFLNGIFNSGLTSICLSLLFGRLKSEYSREVGYAVFYAMVLSSPLVSSYLASLIYDNFDYNVLYKVLIYTLFPGSILLMSIMNNVRLNPRKSLVFFKLAWADFILYACLLLLIAFVLIYGQQYNWLDDRRIVLAIMGIIFFGALFILRQVYRHNCYIDLSVFRSRNFRFGLVLLLILYIIRGAFNITINYFSLVLGFESLNLNELLLVNVGGILSGCMLSTVLIVRKVPMRNIWIPGFLCMLVYYTSMYFLFGKEATAATFIPLLIVQGLGQGLLMGPVILFIISSVPRKKGPSAASIGVFFRFTSFSLSLALINYFELYFTRIHEESMRSGLTILDEGFTQRLQQTTASLQARGVLPDKAASIAVGILNKAVQKQAYIEFSMNYYQWISMLIILIIILILVIPSINWTIINVRHNKPEPAEF